MDHRRQRLVLDARRLMMWLPITLCAATFLEVIGLGIVTIIHCCRESDSTN